MMTQKSVGNASLMILFAGLLAITGCSDEVEDQDPDAGGWIDLDDAQDDAESVDADSYEDVEEVDADEVDAVDDEDVDDEEYTTRGWYRTSFESALFVADSSLLSGDWEGGCQLPLWQNADEAGVERWWANGIPDSQLVGVYPPSATVGSLPLVGLVDATGELSEPGEYGHMGAYARSFDVSESEVDVCGTFEALRHCVVPPSGQWCTVQDVESFELVDPYLIRELPGPEPENPSLFYDLRISSDKSGEWSELRLSLEVPAEDQSGEEGQVPTFEVDELYGMALTERIEAAGVTDTTFENLTGWVALDTTAFQESIYVSISGTDDEGNEAAVWGYFSVDETIAYP